MSGLISRFRKKNTKSDNTSQPPQPPQPVEIEAPISSIDEPSPPATPTEPPVQISSIFTGLHLSSKVVRDEGSNSPYTSRATDEGGTAVVEEEEKEKETSSFAFLSSSKKEDVEVEESSNNISQGFSFLNQQASVELGEAPSESTEHVNLPPSPNDVDSAGTEEPNRSKPKPDESGILVRKSEEPLLPPICKQPQSSKPKPETLIQKSEEPSLLTASRRQAPLSGEKRKKRKALRPGQSLNKEDTLPQVPRNDPNTSSARTQDKPVEVTRHTNKDSPMELNLGQVHSTADRKQPASSTPTELTNNNDKDQCAPAELTSNIDRDQLALTELTSSIDKDQPAPTELTSNIDRDQLAPTELTSSIDKNQPTPAELDDRDQPARFEELHNNSRKVSQTSPTETKDEGDIEEGNTCANNDIYDIKFTTEESLTSLLQSYASGLANIRRELASTEEKHRQKVLQQLLLARKQVDRRSKDLLLRDKEAKALAEEDYELAEQVNKQLETSGETVEREIISISLAEIREWLVKCSEEKDNEVSFQKEMETKLCALREEQNLALENLKKEHASILAKEKMQLQSLESKTEREAGHIALDCGHLQKREQLLMEETSDRAKDFITRKEKLEKQLTDVESEITSLEAQLLILKKERSDIIANITAEEKQIKAVEEELSDERQQLESEHTTLQERQAKLATQQKVVEERRKFLQTIEGKHEEKEQSMQVLVVEANSVWDEVHEAISGKDQHKLYIQELHELLNQGQKLLAPSNKLISAQETVERKRKDIEEHTGFILSGQTELGEKRKKLRDLQAQVLQLQESKKTAVTGRQFREAGRLSNLIKDMSNLIEEEQEKLAQAEQEMKACNDTLSLLSDELSRLREDLTQIERSEDEGHIQDLVEASSALNSKREVLSGSFLIHVVDSWKDLYSLISESLHAKHGLAETTTAKKTNFVPERTPGVGMEERSEEREFKLRVAKIEAEIDMACQNEDYDQAAELEEELQTLKANHNIS